MKNYLLGLWCLFVGHNWGTGKGWRNCSRCGEDWWNTFGR